LKDHCTDKKSFDTKVNKFSDSINEMSEWLDEIEADCGTDGAEAVADGLTMH
jgi:hypothetical protein